jgi:hypothetical protein
MLPVKKNLGHFRVSFQTKSDLYFHPTIIFISNIYSVEIVCMLRYSVDEENVGGKEIEARSEA